MRRICDFPLRLWLPLVLAGTPALAQDSDSGPLLAEPTNRLVRATSNVQPDLRVDVNMTLVPVTVLDSMGRSVTGLTAGNFRVFDNSRNVPIASFARQDQPIAVGLVFDCSRSMVDKFRREREAAGQLFRRLSPTDQSFLVTVSRSAKLRVPLTSDLDAVANPLIFTRPDGRTPLLDGVYLGLTELRKSRLARKALLVVSDGGDNQSRYTLREIDNLAAESDAQIFTIVLYNNPLTMEEVEGPRLMNHLANQSGGVNFIVQNLEDIQQAMADVGTSLHNQYLLGYYIPDNGDHKYHRIAVQLLVPRGTPALRLRARAGYYAP